MKFDSNAAWKEAAAAVSANREVLLALAGVFLVLPSIAFSLFFPQPEPPAGATAEQMLATFREFYAGSWMAMLPMAVLQMAGTLAMLTLFTDRSRPTVGEAIGQGFAAVPTYLGAQLLLGLALGALAIVLIGVAGVTGVPAIVAIAIIAMLVVAIYGGIKVSLTAPVVAVEGERNPVKALRRSWQLTKGNSFRLALFYFLIAIAFFLVIGIVMAVIGMILTLAVGGETAKIVAAVLSGVLGAVFALYFVAILASVHRQLAGPSASAISATFE